MTHTPLVPLALLILGVQCRLLPPSSITRRLPAAEDEGEIWAVLVAGSSGWYNYRHQADVCHSYHVLVEHGVKKENIITMMYDDIANNTENPYPGKIFNHPHGKDVYEGVTIDYRKHEVTPRNFIAVLEGRAKDTNGKKVLKSTEKDRVFIYFADHGGVGLISFPDSILTVKDLQKTLRNMHTNKRYKELTFYLETCESGSMFDSVLPSDLNIYAVSAANAHESSWGCYCDPANLKIDTCLGDTFSVNWMEDSDWEDLQAETLFKQYKIIKAKTNESHVSRFGDKKIPLEPVADFQGMSKHFGDSTRLSTGPANYKSWPSRDIPLKSAEAKHAREVDEEKRSELQNEISVLRRRRELLKYHVYGLAKKLVQDPANRKKVLKKGRNLITQLDCHHDVMHAFNRLCYPFHEVC